MVNNMKIYVYIGVGVGVLFVGIGGVIFLIKWIYKKKVNSELLM